MLLYTKISVRGCIIDSSKKIREATINNYRTISHTLLITFRQTNLSMMIDGSCLDKLGVISPHIAKYFTLNISNIIILSSQNNKCCPYNTTFLLSFWGLICHQVEEVEGFKPCFLGILQSLQEGCEKTFVTMLWCIWKRRNEKVW